MFDLSYSVNPSGGGFLYCDGLVMPCGLVGGLTTSLPDGEIQGILAEPDLTRDDYYTIWTQANLLVSLGGFVCSPLAAPGRLNPKKSFDRAGVPFEIAIIQGQLAINARWPDADIATLLWHDGYVDPITGVTFRVAPNTMWIFLSGY
jgi:hypothetical protein